jgi:rfaE bifunctional protein nucleotidyltransferase chain/domain
VNSAEKIVLDWDTLEQRVSDSARPLVFTNGVFDILHRGHVAYLEEAAALGATLLVALNSDPSVQLLGKAPERPVNPLEDRLAVVASLGCVDLVTVFDDDTPLKLILRVRPDHLVKGGAWPADDIVGADEVRANGGVVHSLPFRYQRSTSDLIARIRNA